MGRFDDLIPKKGGSGGGGRFDDLIPPTAPSGVTNKPAADGGMFQLPDTSAPGYWGGVGNRLHALARAGVSGLTFGLADKGAALADTLSGNMSWDKANEKQTKLREADRAAIDAVNPGTFSAVEFGSSLANPAVAGKFLAPEAGMLKSGLAYGTEGAAKGGVNAYGHGGSWEDIAEGAAWGGGLGGLGGAIAAPFAKWWSGGTRAAPPPPAPKTLQEVFRPAPAPPAPTSRVANAVESLGNAPKLTTMAADTGLAAIGLPPVATTASTWAQTLAPAVKNYMTRDAGGRLLVNPQAAQEAREVLARLSMAGGAKRP